MARAATSTDVFNAVGEIRRREIVQLLSNGRNLAVNELADRLGMLQPAVSKHLGVLRKVGLVTVIKDGRMRRYRLDASKLKPVHDWVSLYEQFWSNQLQGIKERAEKIAKGSSGKKS